MFGERKIDLQLTQHAKEEIDQRCEDSELSTPLLGITWTRIVGHKHHRWGVGFYDGTEIKEGWLGTFGTFSSKIEMLFRMGLIDQGVKNSLHLIRKIRNEFAHRLINCDFTSKKILQWNAELHKLNDVATKERRKSFSPGAVGDFEKSVSWLIYLLKTFIQKMPTECPGCGSEMEHRIKMKAMLPTDH